MRWNGVVGSKERGTADGRERARGQREARQWCSGRLSGRRTAGVEGGGQGAFLVELARSWRSGVAMEIFAHGQNRSGTHGAQH